MDITDINRIACRKRMNADAEKLREKVSRETTKIIKLKVAQDTAYWDLKEKLHQVENNHERLQQNMVEVQMQHEAISGQYQEELRLRPETLNKLTSTREICNVLEEYSSRLKETLSRCKADQAALCEAYQRSGQFVRELRGKQAEADDRHRQVVAGLEDKLKLTSEHQGQLLQMLSDCNQRCESELRESRSALGAALSRRDQLVADVNELNRTLDQCRLDMEKKDENITSLQNDIKQLLHEFNSQATEMKNTLIKLEKDLNEATESNQALKKALTNQEDFTKTVCEQNNTLQEKISSLEEEQINVANLNKDLEAKLKDAILTSENLKVEVSALIKKEGDLEIQIGDKNTIIANMNSEILCMKNQINELEEDKVELGNQLNKTTEELKCKSEKIEEITASGQEMQKKIQDMENDIKLLSESTEVKIQELTYAIQEKDKDLDSKTATITGLMSEIKSGTDARSKLEGNIQKLRKDMEMEKENAMDRQKMFEKQIEQLQNVIKEKEDDLNKQMTIILDMRSEKERLQEKIQGMKNTIDNIQKELTGRTNERIQAEMDDNAVMLTPSHKASLMEKIPSPKKPVEFAVPRSPKESMLFNFLSDSSMDGDTIDALEVNRRFEALSRGERVSPMPLSSLKRRRGGVPAAQGGLRMKLNHPEKDAPISLSQVKTDLQNKDRTFFKNKRVEAKSKKPN